jgi:hypothetical protein
MTVKNTKNPIQIDSVESYLREIFSFQKITHGSVRCYRGQGNVTWDISPTIMRGNLIENAENQVISELMVEAPEEFANDKSMLDRLVRARHYGLPTRLLDVSLNPLVALYFACAEKDAEDNDALVVCLDFDRTRVKFADSDAISLISNLSRLSDTERNQLRRAKLEFDKERADKKSALDKFRGLEPVGRLNHFVREEKPYFLNLINPDDLFKYYFVYPKKSNRRLIAQSGGFVAAGLLEFKRLSSPKIIIRRMLIKRGCKEAIISQLDEININSRTIFPEIESITKYIHNSWRRQ